MDFMLAKKQIEKLKMNLSAAQIQALAQPYHERLQRANKAGVIIAAGSDMYMDLGLSRGQAAKRVLFAYAEAGMGLKDILLATTINAAKLIGEENLGRLTKGAFADIIAVAGNPLQNLSALEKVVFIMKNGEVFKSVR